MLSWILRPNLAKTLYQEILPKGPARRSLIEILQIALAEDWKDSRQAILYRMLLTDIDEISPLVDPVRKSCQETLPAQKACKDLAEILPWTFCAGLSQAQILTRTLPEKNMPRETTKKSCPEIMRTILAKRSFQEILNVLALVRTRDPPKRGLAEDLQRFPFKRSCRGRPLLVGGGLLRDPAHESCLPTTNPEVELLEGSPCGNHLQYWHS